MAAYYNEIDPFSADWLKELIKAGHIAHGEVDNRSIEDVTPSDLAGFTQCHFFAGIGVWSYALRKAGWPDDRPVWTGSCPCQPFSTAGEGNGFADERHLWPAFFHLISQFRPVTVFGEQVAAKDGLAWLDLVQADLEGAGYTSGAVDTPACGFGAPHIRQRLYWVAESGMANTISQRLEGHSGDGNEETGRAAKRPTAGTGDPGELDNRERPGPTNGFWRDVDWLFCRDGKWRAVRPRSFPLAHGTTNRVGLLRGYGNAIVTTQAEEFIRAYMEVCNDERG